MLRSLFFPLSAILLFLTWESAFADVGVSYKIHHHYQGPRPLGMGDAFVAVANDYNTLFYNPAGLARLEQGELNLFIDAGVSNAFQSIAKEIQEAQSTPGTQADKESAVMAALQKQYGKAFGFRTQLFSGIYVRPKWGIAVIPADLSFEGSMHQAVGPSVNATFYADTTVALGYGDEVPGLRSWGAVSWGVTAKAINRGYFSKSINFVELATDPNLIKSSDVREGFGIDADIGFLYTPRLPGSGLFSLLKYTRPTFGLVVRNLAETKFASSNKFISKEEGLTPPEQLYRVVDIGTKWEYPSFWLFSGRGVMDFRDIMHPSYTLKRGLHLGFEFDWTVASWWKGAYRIGYRQGYVTAGMSALFALFNLDLVTYSDEVGTPSTPVENRVYALRMNVNW